MANTTECNSDLDACGLPPRPSPAEALAAQATLADLAPQDQRALMGHLPLKAYPSAGQSSHR